MPLDFEKDYYSKKIKLIAGTDEAGRGPLAGPVVAAAVVFPKGYQNDLIDDSKKLSEKKRELLFDIIKRDAISYGIGIVSAERIDLVNIYEASREAMIIAINNLNCNFDLVISDAMKIETLNVEVIPLIKGDQKALSVAAASILAKVTRDRMMCELDKEYPQYGFKIHKGYGTKMHLEALKEFGPIKGIHRFSYRPVKEIIFPEIKLF